MKLRKATIKDVDKVVELCHQYDLHEHRLDKRVEVTPLKEYRKGLADMLRKGERTFLLFEDDSRAVGFIDYGIQIRNKIKMGTLNDIFIINKYRGRGLGTRLIHHVLDKMRKENCKYVKSGVRSKNIKAQELWIKEGFKINKRPKAIDYTMRKEL